MTSSFAAAERLLSLADLCQHLQRDGRWWSAVPAVGEAKARRIAEFLRLL